MITTIAYLLTAVACFLPLVTALQFLFGGLYLLAMRIIVGSTKGGSLHFSGLFGAMLSWSVVGYLWKTFEGGHVPIAALTGALIYRFIFVWLTQEKLTYESSVMISAEQWAIIILGGLLMWNFSTIRWY